MALGYRMLSNRPFGFPDSKSEFNMLGESTDVRKMVHAPIPSRENFPHCDSESGLAGTSGYEPR